MSVGKEDVCKILTIGRIRVAQTTVTCIQVHQDASGIQLSHILTVDVHLDFNIPTSRLSLIVCHASKDFNQTYDQETAC